MSAFDFHLKLFKTIVPYFCLVCIWLSEKIERADTAINTRLFTRTEKNGWLCLNIFMKPRILTIVIPQILLKKQLIWTMWVISMLIHLLVNLFCPVIDLQNTINCNVLRLPRNNTIKISFCIYCNLNKTGFGTLTHLMLKSNYQILFASFNVSRNEFLSFSLRVWICTLEYHFSNEYKMANNIVSQGRFSLFPILQHNSNGLIVWLQNSNIIF